MEKPSPATLAVDVSAPDGLMPPYLDGFTTSASQQRIEFTSELQNLLSKTGRRSADALKLGARYAEIAPI
jgi:hypothetical protein